MPNDLQLDVLEALASAQNYNRWLADLTFPYLGDDPLEIGSGIGINASLWLESGLTKLTVSERDPTALHRLEERFADNPRVQVRAIDLEETPSANFSSLTALNVLEHIEDDCGALRSAGRLVRPGGAVVVFVPAFQFAAGRFDRRIGHFRRYTVSSLSTTFTDAGLDLQLIRYVNAPGLVAWFVSVKLLGMEPREGPLLQIWDRFVIPVTRRSETARRPPFGQSVLAVGRTPATGDA